MTEVRIKEKEVPVEEVYESFIEEFEKDPEYEKLKEFLDPEILKEQIQKEYAYYDSRSKHILGNELIEFEKEVGKTEDDEEFQIDKDVSMCFLVDNLPLSKNRKVLEKTFRKRVISLLKVKDDQIFNIHFPMTKKKTLGYAFFEIRNVEKQKNSRFVISKMQSKPLVKKRPNKYLMKVYSLSDMTKYDSYNLEKHEYEKKEFKKEDNYLSHLCEKDGRDQFVVRDQKGVSLQWFDGSHQSTEVVNRYEDRYWLDDEIRWSPFGTYLVTFNQSLSSFELYGTKRGQPIGGLTNLKTINVGKHVRKDRLRSIGSQSFQFTPCETFFCLHDKMDDIMLYLIFDVRSCELVHTIKHNEKQKGSLVTKWSPKDNYLACMNKGKIRVLDTSTFEEVGKVSEQGITGFDWSPLESTLVYYTQEVEEMVAKKPVNEEEQMMMGDGFFGDDLFSDRQLKQKQLQQRNVEMVIYYISVPSFKVVKSKVYFEPYDLRIFWHPDGLFFAVVVEGRQFKQDRLVKVISSIDIYRLKEKGLPVDNIVLHQKVDQVVWEPNNGSKFILLTSTPSTEVIVDQFRRWGDQGATQGKKATKSMFMFRVDDDQTKKMKGTLLSEKDASFVEWSPQGRFFVLGVIGNDHRSNYRIFDSSPVVEETGQVTHFAATSQSWDPSGRYYMVATTRSGGIHENNGFIVYDLAGKLVYEKKFLSLLQIMWRCKPKSLLSSRAIKKLQSPQSVRKFSRLEKQKVASRKKDLEDKYKKEFDEFVKMRRIIETETKKKHSMMMTKKKGYFPKKREQQDEFIELKETVDVVLEETIEVLE